MKAYGKAAINAAKTHCANGHEFTAGNTYWKTRDGTPMRQCKICQRQWDLKRYFKSVKGTLKAKARYLARDAIKRGELIRGLCEVCGIHKVQAHHDDYSRPLNVRWLCGKHHREFHQEGK
jgi:ribosomal protein S27AE